jgi:hypothetical protein
MGEGVADTEQAWTFIQRFVMGWTTPLADGDGVGDAQLDAAEQGLGMMLPQALRAAYRLLGRRPDLTCNQDVLLAPDQCRLDESGEVLVFRVENQACAHWGVRLADAGAEDPPVVFNAGSGWQPFLSRTSLACLEMVLTETLFGGDLLDNACELSVDLLELVTTNYRRLRFPDYPMWADPEASPIHWYAAPGQLLRLDGTVPGSWLFVRGQTTEDLHAICTAIPGEWAQHQGTEM